MGMEQTDTPKIQLPNLAISKTISMCTMLSLRQDVSAREGDRAPEPIFSNALLHIKRPLRATPA